MSEPGTADAPDPIQLARLAVGTPSLPLTTSRS
jgi:hypothetical protein